MFEALFNVRDLGGHETHDGRVTRYGVLYRADGLHRGTAADLMTLQSWGVSTVVDLRTANERTDDGQLTDARFDVRHLPVFEQLTGIEIDRTKESYLEDLYITMISRRAEHLARIVSELADASSPVIFHCTAGKDRTGVIAALVLSAVGVPEQSVAGDFARSHEAMDGLARWYREHRGTTVGGHAPADDTAVAISSLGARPEWILRTLDHVNAEYGSSYDYLRSAGVARESLQSLAGKLLGNK